MSQKNCAFLKEVLLKAVKSAGFEVNADDLHLEKTKTLDHGHFATNVAMLLAGKLGKSPREIAQAIVDHIEDASIQKADIAGPGFINLWIEQKFYTKEIQAIISNPNDYLQASLQFNPGEKTMVIEYSSPNIAKPLGVHHLLSTIIGDALSKTYKAYGYKVISENYPGDIGTQFGKLIYAIKTWGNESEITQNPIDELLKLYVKFHNEAEEDPTLEDHGRAEYKKFEEGGSENRDMWEKIVEWSMQEIQPLYDRLNIHYDGVHGESFFEERMHKILERGRKQGVFVDGEAGAWIVLPDDPNDPPALVKKSDGTTLYLTRDLAQIEFFEEEYHPDIMVWAVDTAQSLHFKQRFAASRKLNLTPAQLVHVSFGRMSFKDVKMSTRKGNILRLKEVLDEAEERAFKLAQERARDLSAPEQKELARIMGIGSVKYNILSQNRIQNITFDWDKMLSFEGNSAPYLMYTAARAKSILRKAEINVKESQKYELNLTDDHETRVMIDLMMFPDTLRRAADEFKPNHIANTLYQLAQDYNTLYNALPILKADEEAQKTRLLLTAGLVTVMEYGLSLLGIEVPERM